MHKHAQTVPDKDGVFVDLVSSIEPHDIAQHGLGFGAAFDRLASHLSLYTASNVFTRSMISVMSLAMVICVLSSLHKLTKHSATSVKMLIELRFTGPVPWDRPCNVVRIA